MKKQFKDEILKLRRQVSSKGDFDGVTSKKALAKSRSELKIATTKLKDREQQLKKLKHLPPGMLVVDSALQACSKSNEEKRHLYDEIAILEQKIEELESNRKNNYYEKAKFMEGASWLADKMITELQKFERRESSILEEFDSRCDQIAETEDHDPNVREWLKESLLVSRMEMVEQIQAMKENSEFHRDDAKRKLEI